MRFLLIAALPLPFLLLQEAEGGSFSRSNVAKISSWKADIVSRRTFIAVRGGADIDLDEEDEDVDGEDEEDDEEEELELDPKLTKAAIQSTAKVQMKKSMAVKEAVSTSLKIKKSKRKGSAFKVPYVIRTFMNPFTVFAMTRAYFGSLFNLNFMKEQVRSASSDSMRYNPSNLTVHSHFPLSRIRRKPYGRRWKIRQRKRKEAAPVLANARCDQGRPKRSLTCLSLAPEVKLGRRLVEMALGRALLAGKPAE